MLRHPYWIEDRRSYKIIFLGLENAEKLQSYSMKVNGAIQVGDEKLTMRFETGLDANVIRNPEMIISGERSVSLFGKPISGRYYFANELQKAKLGLSANLAFIALSEYIRLAAFSISPITLHKCRLNPPLLRMLTPLNHSIRSV